MPVLSKSGLRIDDASEGTGSPVVLVHSSVSGNRQWRALTDDLADRHRVLAVNLYGYGETTPWPGPERQTPAAQADLIVAVCDGLDAVQLVGHSLGGSVALMAALVFADYWLGDGAWAGMPERRQAAFIESLPPNRHEWDAVGNEETDVAGYGAVTARTLLVSDPATRRPIREIVEIFAAGCPAWSFQSVEQGGHMAPLTRPDLVNPILREFLGARWPSAEGRRRSAAAGGSGHRARRPCRPPRASGS